MVRCDDAKLKEDQFIARLSGNVGAGTGFGPPQAGDSLTLLREATGGKLLRAELERQYPLCRTISVRAGGPGGLFAKQGDAVVLKGCVVARLKKLVEQGHDEETLSLSELHARLQEEAEAAGRNKCALILALFSPTGWAAEAQQFVRNDPPGSGWASGVVHPILIGPEITELVWDMKDSKLRPYVQYFCGLTVEERKSVCRDEIQRAVLIQEFANLEKIAEARGFDVGFVKDVAKELCRQSKELKLATVRGVGPVVKRTL
ncbi:MAG: hypothetical protein A2Y77_12375 [Planctomycetes bacterium RBG_13_62_9]|nr:MAG: hypothetical protein A2Y77_12375 [Planctomycetes bacterium RBG_13_62_9]